MTTHTLYSIKLVNLFNDVRSTSNMSAKRDLTKLWKNCMNIHTEMDKEMVNCRRLSKITAHYTELETRLLQAFEQLEQMITFSKLLY